MEWPHPISLEQEIAINIEVAAIIAANFSAKLLHNLVLVQILADPSQCRIAEIARILTFATDIVNVLTKLVKTTVLHGRNLYVLGLFSDMARS